jgi:hypothetical protein
MTIRARVLSLALLATVIAVSSALAGRSDTSFTVTSSLDGKTVLPIRSHWTAVPNTTQPVAEVDFFIDGYHAWTSHSAPWTFGDSGNWLVTTHLKPGMHKFAVRAIVLPDQVAADAFTAQVVAPAKPPARLAGTWTRRGQMLQITQVGWVIAPNTVVDARYLSNGEVVLGPLIIDRPEQTPVCGANAPQTWKAALSADRRSLKLSPIGTDGCAQRVATFEAAWKRG